MSIGVRKPSAYTVVFVKQGPPPLTTVSTVTATENSEVGGCEELGLAAVVGNPSKETRPMQAIPETDPADQDQSGP